MGRDRERKKKEREVYEVIISSYICSQRTIKAVITVKAVTVNVSSSAYQAVHVTLGIKSLNGLSHQHVCTHASLS